MQKLWTTIVDAFNITWTIYLCDSDDPVLDDGSAIVYPDKNTIYVRSDGDPVKVSILLFHELLHVNFSAPGDPPVIRALLGTKDVDQTKEREENIVTFLAPRLYSLLIKNGMLKMPEKPT